MLPETNTCRKCPPPNRDADFVALQGISKRGALGCVRMRCTLALSCLAVVKQNTTLSPYFTQPGVNLLEIPCIQCWLKLECLWQPWVKLKEPPWYLVRCACICMYLNLLSRYYASRKENDVGRDIGGIVPSPIADSLARSRISPTQIGPSDSEIVHDVT